MGSAPATRILIAPRRPSKSEAQLTKRACGSRAAPSTTLRQELRLCLDGRYLGAAIQSLTVSGASPLRPRSTFCAAVAVERPANSGSRRERFGVILLDVALLDQVDIGHPCRRPRRRQDHAEIAFIERPLVAIQKVARLFGVEKDIAEGERERRAVADAQPRRPAHALLQKRGIGLFRRRLRRPAKNCLKALSSLDWPAASSGLSAACV